MSLEGLLAVAGIALAIYAIAQPVQRRSIGLFVPPWLLPAALGVSALIVVSAQWVATYRGPVPQWFGFAVPVVTFALPVVATILAVWLWNRAKLTSNTTKLFHAFLLACLREKRYDELVRILEKNPDRAVTVLEPETLDLLFEPRFVQAMTNARTWLHLRLLTHQEIVKRLPSRSRTIDTVIRAYASEPGSILHAPVAYSYGAEDHSFCTEEDWKLIEATFQNPDWYMSLRVDYPLLLNACEKLDSGRLDDAYNRFDSLYIAHQGISSRSLCPIFIALKTHVLMLEEAIKNDEPDETDYFVSDLWDVFRTVCEHSRYAAAVWEHKGIDREYPTTYAYLLSQIVNDFHLLCKNCYSHGERTLSRLGRELAMFWSLCVAHLAENDGRVSPQMQRRVLHSYLECILEVRDCRPGNVEDNRRQQNCQEWSQMFIDQTRSNIIPNNALRPLVEEVVNGLDICKDHVSRNEEWLRTELNLPSRPEPS